MLNSGTAKSAQTWTNDPAKSAQTHVSGTKETTDWNNKEEDQILVLQKRLTLDQLNLHKHELMTQLNLHTPM